jgi:hypothetical protein
MTTLRETQQLLWALITAPEGVAKALAADADSGGAQQALLARTVRGDERLSAAERLDIYANMYFYRLLDVLRADFPALVKLVGDAAFHNLTTDYLLRHFPTHYSLRYAGAQLPGFVAAHALALERPYLGDLATFEWALVDAFDAPDAPCLTRAELGGFSPDRWPALRLRLHPAARLCTFRWPVHEVRQRVDAGEPAPVLEDLHTSLCIWRQGFRVRYRQLPPFEWAALQLLASGATFAAACAAADEACDDGTAAQRLAGALAAWVDDGLLGGLDKPR